MSYDFPRQSHSGARSEAARLRHQQKQAQQLDASTGWTLVAFSLVLLLGCVALLIIWLLPQAWAVPLALAIGLVALHAWRPPVLLLTLPISMALTPFLRTMGVGAPDIIDLVWVSAFAGALCGRLFSVRTHTFSRGVVPWLAVGGVLVLVSILASAVQNLTWSAGSVNAWHAALQPLWHSHGLMLGLVLAPLWAHLLRRAQPDVDGRAVVQPRFEPWLVAGAALAVLLDAGLRVVDGSAVPVIPVVPAAAGAGLAQLNDPAALPTGLFDRAVFEALEDHALIYLLGPLLLLPWLERRAWQLEVGDPAQQRDALQTLWLLRLLAACAIAVALVSVLPHWQNVWVVPVLLLAIWLMQLVIFGYRSTNPSASAASPGEPHAQAAMPMPESVPLLSPDTEIDHGDDAAALHPDMVIGADEPIVTFADGLREYRFRLLAAAVFLTLLAVLTPKATVAGDVTPLMIMPCLVLLFLTAGRGDRRNRAVALASGTERAAETRSRRGRRSSHRRRQSQPSMHWAPWGVGVVTLVLTGVMVSVAMWAPSAVPGLFGIGTVAAGVLVMFGLLFRLGVVSRKLSRWVDHLAATAFVPMALLTVALVVQLGGPSLGLQFVLLFVGLGVIVASCRLAGRALWPLDGTMSLSVAVGILVIVGLAMQAALTAPGPAQWGIRGESPWRLLAREQSTMTRAQDQAWVDALKSMSWARGFMQLPQVDEGSIGSWLVGYGPGFDRLERTLSGLRIQPVRESMQAGLASDFGRYHAFLEIAADKRSPWLSQRAGAVQADRPSRVVVQARVLMGRPRVVVRVCAEALPKPARCVDTASALLVSGPDTQRIEFVIPAPKLVGLADSGLGTLLSVGLHGDSGTALITSVSWISPSHEGGSPVQLLSNHAFDQALAHWYFDLDPKLALASRATMPVVIYWVGAYGLLGTLAIIAVPALVLIRMLAGSRVSTWRWAMLLGLLAGSFVWLSLGGIANERLALWWVSGWALLSLRRRAPRVRDGVEQPRSDDQRPPMTGATPVLREAMPT